MNKIENLTITDIADEGRAIGKYDNKVVFVQHAVPGDIVNVEIFKKRSKFFEGKVTSIIKKSAHRVDPFCNHFGVCGGCKWQHLNYEAQLHFKQEQVLQALKRIGHIENPKISPIIRSKKIRYYRNRLDFTFSSRRWLTADEINDKSIQPDSALGFHIPKMYDKVLDIKECFLQDDLNNKIRVAIKNYALQEGMRFLNLKDKEGFLRNLILRNTSTGEWMCIIVFNYTHNEWIEKLLSFISTNFLQITSLLYVINQKLNDTIYDQEIKTFKGDPYITEKMESLLFRIGPKSFYQTNSDQAYELYKITRDFAELNGNELVYDLYTGTGTIACFIAANVKKVIGIEYIPEAINDAKINAHLNNITNTEFYSGDMKDILTIDFFRLHGQPDIIITDPPRAGMHEDVVIKLNQSGAEKIVYVSCNPATQARDLTILTQNYTVEKIQPVDMFPHTQHVENVVLLRKINF